jgi:hypothetical protein
MPKLPARYLAKKLAKELPIKGGAVLRTIGDAADVLSLPENTVESNPAWQRAITLLLEQADTETVSRQLHLALFLAVEIDLKAMNNP